MQPWTPDTWRGLPASQQPSYPDSEAVAAAVRELRGLPPLVTSGSKPTRRR